MTNDGMPCILHFLLNGQPVHLSTLVDGAKSVDSSTASFENKVFVTGDSSWFLWSCVNVDWSGNRRFFLVPSWFFLAGPIDDQGNVATVTRRFFCCGRIDPRHRDWFENRRFCCEMYSFLLTVPRVVHELDGTVLANDVN